MVRIVREERSVNVQQSAAPGEIAGSEINVPPLALFVGARNNENVKLKLSPNR